MRIIPAIQFAWQVGVLLASCKHIPVQQQQGGRAGAVSRCLDDNTQHAYMHASLQVSANQTKLITTLMELPCRSLGLNLPATVVFDYPTILALAKHAHGLLGSTAGAGPTALASPSRCLLWHTAACSDCNML